jgi:hypothetical protein
MLLPGCLRTVGQQEVEPRRDGPLHPISEFRYLQTTTLHSPRKCTRNATFFARRSDGCELAGQEKRGSGTTADKRLRDDHTLIIEVWPAVFAPVLEMKYLCPRNWRAVRDQRTNSSAHDGRRPYTGFSYRRQIMAHGSSFARRLHQSRSASLLRLGPHQNSGDVTKRKGKQQ